jgi:hypothetical protein
VLKFTKKGLENKDIILLLFIYIANIISLAKAQGTFIATNTK